MPYTQPALAPTAQHAPILPDDKARAAELWESVKGTALEDDFRRVSREHPDKDASRMHYLAFLADIEGLFAAPEADPWEASQPAPVTQPVLSAPQPEPTPEPEPQPTPAPTPAPEVQPDATPAPEASTPEEGAAEPEPVSDAQDAPSPIATLAAPVHSGLIAQLAGLLADGGELTFQLLRVGGDVTIGIFPKPHPGEAAPVPFMLTETPDWMDANLVTAMQGYAGARRDAFSVAQQAAQRQQAANKKAADKPVPTPAKAKTSVLTLKAAEGTTLKGTLGGKDVPLVVGKNDVPQGTLEIVATHPAFGEVKKTVATHANKEHDFTEQQGARVTVNVTPQSAALEATKGDTVIALHHGIEILLAPGTWVVNAQAAEHATANQTISVKAGKPQVIEMTLKEEQRLF
ncbi:hypothetical protein [Deinococcus xianganensis]|uniref:Uncharacterized protein n=1 Tax=Deinococcus xianganensis TaxID=1507289 RepID=A0A6I4YGT4_9DEIO|nr:hypothetical protein [Deinococcus xianganensis]MXV19670.1 hypothetical protein [Deinococcus xianganensis]